MITEFSELDFNNTILATCGVTSMALHLLFSNHTIQLLKENFYVRGISREDDLDWCEKSISTEKFSVIGEIELQNQIVIGICNKKVDICGVVPGDNLLEIYLWI